MTKKNRSIKLLAASALGVTAFGGGGVSEIAISDHLAKAADATPSAKEVARSEYDAVAKVDVNHELKAGKDNSWVTHDSSIEISLKNPNNIHSGDTVTFTTDGFEFNIPEGTEIKLQDGTVIGKYHLVKTERESRGIQSWGSDEDKKKYPSDAINYSAKKTHQIIFNDTFSAPNKNWVNAKFKLEYRGWQSHGFADHEREYLASIKDNEGNILDSILFKSGKDDYPDNTSGKISNDAYNSNKFEHSSGTYDMNKYSFISGGGFGYGGNSMNNELNTFTAGTQVTIKATDKLKKSLFVDFTKIRVTGNSLDHPGEIIKDGMIFTVRSYPVIIKTGSPVNANGYYIKTSEDMKIKVVSVTPDSLTYELVDGLKESGGEYRDFFRTDNHVYSLKEVSDKLINTTTGRLRDGEWGKDAFIYKVVNTTNNIDKTFNGAFFSDDVGFWQNGEGRFNPLYNSSLNAVLEDGTVIKENMAQSGLLKIGEGFTLKADEKITYNGAVYVPKDSKLTVDGKTVNNTQVLTKTYVLSPADNHAFVDLTVNHIDQETGKVMKTDTSSKHEETTTYKTDVGTFDGYNLVATPNNATGIFAKDNVVVNYYYVHKKGNVISKFVDKDGKEIASAVNVVKNQNTGTDYTVTHPNKIEYNGMIYRWKNVEGSETGKVTEGTTTITNHYEPIKKSSGDEFVDDDGRPIKADITVVHKLADGTILSTKKAVEKGNAGSQYTTSPEPPADKTEYTEDNTHIIKTVTNYVANKPDNASGIIPAKGLTVTYVYTPNSTVTKIDKEKVVKTTPINFTTSYKNDSTLPYNKTRTDIVGVDGENTKVEITKLVNGQPTTTTEVRRTKEPTNSVISVGSGKVTTEKIPHGTKYVPSNSDQSKTDEGKDGVKTITTTSDVDPNNGNLSNPKTKEEVTTPPVDTVIHVPNVKVTTEKIPHGTKYVPSDSDQSKTDEGKDGVKKVTTTSDVDPNKGNLLNPKTKEEVTTPPVDTVIHVPNVKVEVKKTDDGVDIITTTYEVDPNTGKLINPKVSTKHIKDAEIRTEVIPHGTRYVPSDNGQTRTDEGKDGVKTLITKYEVDKSGNKSNPKTTEEITTPPIDTVVHVPNVTVEVKKTDDGVDIITTTYEVDPKTGKLVNPKVTTKHIKDTETKTEAIPHGTKYVPSNGDQTTTDEGKDGVKTITTKYEVDKQGNLSNPKTTEEVTTPPIDTIVHVPNIKVETRETADGKDIITTTYEVDPKTGKLINPKVSIKHIPNSTTEPVTKPTAEPVAEPTTEPTKKVLPNTGMASNQYETTLGLISALCGIAVIQKRKKTNNNSEM